MAEFLRREDRIIQNLRACMTMGKISKNQLSKPKFGKQKTLTEPEQELQIEFSEKINNKKRIGEHQILIAVERFSK